MAGVNGVNRQLTDMVNEYSCTRTGTVVQVDPMYAVVDVGETPIRAAFVRQSEPLVGDQVAIVRQGASWFVLGTQSVSGGNAVQNPSFEDVTAGDQPVGWTLYNVTNTSNMASVGMPDRTTDGEFLLEVSPAGVFTGTSFVYSQPIGVQPGEVWELSVHVNGWYPSPGAGFDDTADPGLFALWFANATNLYPTVSDPNTTVQTATNIPDSTPSRVLRGNATVPASTLFMRVGLRSIVAQYTALHWDQATARKVS
jgi:hypothetical protein